MILAPVLLALVLLTIGGVVYTAVTAYVWSPALMTLSPDAQNAILAMRPAILALLIFSGTSAVLLLFTFIVDQIHSRALAQRREIDTNKTGFVRMAADTIRTPLTGLRWITELFLNEDLGSISPAQRQSVDNMQKAIQRMIGLVNELLNVMKLSGGIIHYHPKPYDVNTLIKDVIGDMKSIAEAKYQILAYGEMSKDADITLDPPLIRHVLATLATNAMHLAPVKETIVFHAEPKDQETSIGITYKGNAMELKSIDDAKSPGMVRMDMNDTDNLNMTISWEILAAGQGRFWVRENGPDDHTLFITLPRKGVEV
jgi:signal transduction histidine kinase